jgi:hypothetical protein
MSRRPAREALAADNQLTAIILILSDDDDLSEPQKREVGSSGAMVLVDQSAEALLTQDRS